MDSPTLSDVIDHRSGTDPSVDGRSQRRERNISAARAAVIDLLGDGRYPTLAEIATRAGIATRSVYRYFGDADAAIADAVQHRLDRARAVFASEPAIGATAPFEERLAMLVLRRLRLERLLEPIASHPLAGRMAFDSDVVEALDSEVRAAFQVELSQRPGDAQLAGLLCALFRLRSIAVMRSTFGDSDAAVAAAMRRAVGALLADSPTQAR